MCSLIWKTLPVQQEAAAQTTVIIMSSKLSANMTNGEQFSLGCMLAGNTCSGTPLVFSYATLRHTVSKHRIKVYWWNFDESLQYWNENIIYRQLVCNFATNSNWTLSDGINQKCTSGNRTLRPRHCQTWKSTLQNSPYMPTSLSGTLANKARKRRTLISDTRINNNQVGLIVVSRGSVVQLSHHSLACQLVIPCRSALGRP